MSLDDQAALLAEVRAVADRIRLRMVAGAQGGAASGLLGRGVGSSIEYRDHRPYLIGDDPRALDWRAYARTGQYTLKVYREEVIPHIDLVVDVSASMRMYTDKWRRTRELACFCIESAARARAAVRCFAISVGRIDPIEIDGVLGGSFPEAGPDASRAPDLRAVPWRPRALRVFVSDLLFADEPRRIVGGLASASGQAIVFVPSCTEESDPQWSGSVEVVDVEGGGSRLRRADAALLARYRAAYAAHFAALRAEARARGIRIAQVESHSAFAEALCADGLAAEAIELWA